VVTYYYTHIDVRGWLNYRNRVLHHDNKVLDENPYWGKQDDSLRYFVVNNTKNIKLRIVEYWHPEFFKNFVPKQF
jgi:hypothetical protein